MTDVGDVCWTLVKHITNKSRVKRYAQASCDAKKLANFPRHVPVVLQNLLEKLGGDSILSVEGKAIAPRGKKEVRVKSAEEIDEGFDYIAANAPLSTTDNAHLKWIEKQKNNAASPIYDWKEILIEKAINNLMNDRALALR
eukprot:5975170-Amphidinium_carterae.1